MDNKIIDIGPNKTSIKQFIHSKHDQPHHNKESDLQTLPTIPKIDPKDCLGCTVLMPKQKDGQCFWAKIIKWINEYKNELQSNPDFIKFKVKVGHQNEWEEIVSYNELMNFIDNDESDGVWQFQSVIGHQGPLTQNDPGYKGSAYNVLVHWETLEQTYEPLHIFAKTQSGQVACAEYTQKNNLLDKPGWQQFCRLAKQ